MKIPPKVSVLVPVFNADKYLEKAIQSLLDQTYVNFETLICDDCSTDKSVLIINEISDNRVKKFFNHRNIGNLQTVNFLLQKATGDYICFLDADDWIEIDKLEKQVHFLETNSVVGLCGTNFIRTDNVGNPLFCSNFPTTPLEIEKTLRNEEEPCFCFGSVMIRKEVYQKTGGFRSYFDRIGAADYDWLFRICDHFQAVNLLEPLYFYRDTPNSYTSKIILDTRKRYSTKIAKYFAKQRQEIGIDAIESGQNEDFEKYLWELDSPYREDPSLIFRLRAIDEIYNKKSIFGLKYVLRALMKNPMKRENYQTLNYWLSSIILK